MSCRFADQSHDQRAGSGAIRTVVITSGGKVVGTAQVRLPRPTALPAAVTFRSQVIGLLLAGGAADAVVSLALGIFLARRATRPVRQVTTAARALAAGQREIRLDAGRADEFGEMGAAFSAMADAADQEEKRRQGFAAEVAHELCTPLTILRSQVEGLQVGVLQPTPEALTSLGEEVRRMTRLVADLQILGSACRDPGRAAVHSGRVCCRQWPRRGRALPHKEAQKPGP